MSDKNNTSIVNQSVMKKNASVQMKQQNKQTAEIVALSFAALLVIGSFVFMLVYNWNTAMTDVTINR